MFAKLSAFKRAVLGLSLGLGIVCAGLFALTLIQGPRIRLVQADLAKLTSHRDQRLILTANQPLGSIDSKAVRISPQADFQTLSNGSSVVLQFAQPLDNDTKYTVTIKTKNNRTLTHTFTTKSASFYYLKKHNDRKDEIWRSSVDGQTNEQIYAAENILDFAALDAGLAIITNRRDFSNAIHTFDFATQKTKELTLPSAGTVSRLRVAPNKQSFGFVFMPKGSTQAFDSTLFTARHLHEKPSSVQLFDQPAAASNWYFAPDSASLQIELGDGSTYLTKPNTPPTPVGRFQEIRGFSADGNSLYGQDSQGYVKVDTTTLQTSRLPAKPLGDNSFVTDIDPLHTQAGYVLRGLAFIEGAYSEYLLKKDGDKQQVAYKVTGETSILYADISANDQYVGVSTSKLKDGQPHQTISIVNIKEGKTIRQLDGTNVRW